MLNVTPLAGQNASDRIALASAKLAPANELNALGLTGLTPLEALSKLFGWQAWFGEVKNKADQTQACDTIESGLYYIYET